MADFPITRPESITPTSNTGEHDSQRNDPRQRRRARPAPEVAKPSAPDESHEHEEDNNHQLDELA